MKCISGIIVCLLFFGRSDFYAQNLVKNPGFEQFVKLPTFDEFSCSDWKSVCGTIDYFNKNAADRKCSAPDNEFGHHNPHGGNGYIGLIVFSQDGVQEFVQQELKAELIKDQIYKVSFYVKFASRTRCYSTWNIGACLSTSKIVCANNVPDYSPREDDLIVYSDYNYLKNVHTNAYFAQVVNAKGKYIVSNKWVLVEGLYKANGGEKYITLGGFAISDARLDALAEKFKDNEKKSISKLKDYLLNNVLRQELSSQFLGFTDYAYYFFDDVSVAPYIEKVEVIQPVAEELKSDTVVFEKIAIDSIKVGSSVILNNIYFDFDMSVLLSKSFVELNKLVQTMQQNPGMELEIQGHTDNDGPEDYNLDLSLSRAKAVMDYLISKGIAEQRLTYNGFGSERPIADNATEEGREKNRRVEFVMLKK